MRIRNIPLYLRPLALELALEAIDDHAFARFKELWELRRKPGQRDDHTRALRTADEAMPEEVRKRFWQTWDEEVLPSFLVRRSSSSRSYP